MIEIEGGRLEKDSILTGDSGIASGIVAVVAYARGLGLNRRYRLVFLGKSFLSFFSETQNPGNSTLSCLT